MRKNQWKVSVRGHYDTQTKSARDQQAWFGAPDTN